MAHQHDHSHARKDFGRAFAIGVALNLGFVIVEVWYGVVSQSLALVADAGHNLSDVLALLLAWGASILVRRIPTTKHTYGMRSTSILAALVNAVLLLLAMAVVAWEAIQRLMNPAPVEGQTIIWVATLGIIINTATALMFMSGRHRDLNIRGAFMHMAADAGVSLGVVLAGIAIVYTGWEWLDPVVSLVIAGVVVVGTWGLLKDSVNMALDAVPEGIEPGDVRAYLEGLPGVCEVHDLHIWPMSTTETALTAHLVIPNYGPSDALLNEVAHQLHDRFGIEHTTIQIEVGDAEHPCGQAPAHAL
ncbi:MAG: cation diffusion facilitator family transporter [Anaerolineae bacterium]